MLRDPVPQPQTLTIRRNIKPLAIVEIDAGIRPAVEREQQNGYVIRSMILPSGALTFTCAVGSFFSSDSIMLLTAFM
jgi:hypothetical protein